jgi:glycosyltransferase involved in cell wall biosynthesis
MDVMIQKRNITIGFCSYENPNDKKPWSGILYYTKKMLQKYCGKVINIGHENYKFLYLRRKMNKLFETLLKTNLKGKNTKYDMEEIYENLIKFSKKDLYENIKKNKYDFHYFPAGSFLLANLNTTLPTLYLSDTTAKLLLDYYPSFMKLDNFSKEICLKFEKEAIEKASKIIYSSKWAAKSAVNDYGCKENKIHIAPFGANLEVIPSHDELLSHRKRFSNKCSLLFVGVDWLRKGGQIAFETMLELNKRGINTELILCGSKLPNHLRHENLTLIEFLDKNKKEQMRKLVDLYMKASFFILPTRAECAGVVFSEAAAYGLPVITTNTGGVPSYVEDGINGRLLTLDASVNDYADIIEKIWIDKKLYINMCENARDKYEKELNWDSWGQKMNKIIPALIGQRG